MKKFIDLKLNDKVYCITVNKTELVSGKIHYFDITEVKELFVRTLTFKGDDLLVSVAEARISKDNIIFNRDKIVKYYINTQLLFIKDLESTVHVSSDSYYFIDEVLSSFTRLMAVQNQLKAFENKKSLFLQNIDPYITQLKDEEDKLINTQSNNQTQ